MTLIPRNIPYLFLMTIIAVLYAGGANAAGKFNFSTKPLHSLAASIMEGVDAPALILDSTKSLHHMSLPPSTIRKLQNAEIVVWMGPDIEPFLQNALKAVPANTTIHDLGNITAKDVHWWTDPGQAIALIAPLSKIIIENDPQNRAIYRANANALTIQLEEMTATISNALSPFAETRFLTLHEAYGGFNSRFGLQGGEVIEHNGTIGAKTIARLRGELVQSNIDCVFGEAGENNSILKTLLDGTDTKSEILDAIGTNLAAGPPFYENLIRQIANTYEACFKAK